MQYKTQQPQIKTLETRNLADSLDRDSNNCRESARPRKSSISPTNSKDPKETKQNSEISTQPSEIIYSPAFYSQRGVRTDFEMARMFPELEIEKTSVETLEEENRRLEKENRDLRADLEDLKEVFGVQTFAPLRKDKGREKRLKGQIEFLREIVEKFRGMFGLRDLSEFQSIF